MPHKTEVARDERILTAATALMARNGFAATSAQDIADAAHVNKALIFYYFGSKAKLYEQILDGYLAGLHQALSQLANVDACTPAERVHRMIDAWIDYIDDNPDYPRLVNRELANADGLHDLIARYNGRNYELVASLIGDVSGDAGSPTSPHQLYTSFVGLVMYYYLSAPVQTPIVDDPLSPKARDARRAHVHWMIDAVLSALIGGAVSSG